MPLPTIPDIVPIDWNDSEFQIPSELMESILSDAVRPVVADVTTGVVGGEGVFDQIMASISAHLKVEYDKSRITGAEYTNAYIALTQSALQNSVQFVLNRDQAFWQAKQAQLAAIQARVQLEIAKMQYAYLVPAQIRLIQEQLEVQRAQTMDTRTDGPTVVGLVGRQKELLAQQKTSYQRDSEVKVAKLFADAWTVQKTIDEGLVAPANFTNAEIDEVLSNLKSRVDLGT